MNKIVKCKLGDIGKVCMCKRVLKKQTNTKAGIPFFKISTFGNKEDCYISRELFEEYKTKFSYPQKGDILISAAGTLGRTVVYKGEDAYYQDSNIVWIANDGKKVTNDFLYYFYQLSPWKKTTGSTIDRLYNDNIRNTEITFPESIDFQRQVTGVLKAIDEKIENNNKINVELESMAKTIYDYWFLQFEFPNEDGKPYKSSGGKMVWNEELKREIPEGWEIDAIGKHIDIDRGISYSSDDLEGEGIPLINLSSFNIDSTYKPEGLKTYSGTYGKEKIINPFDLVICVTQQTAIDLVGNTDVIGKAFLVPDIFESKDILASMDVIKIQSDNVYGKYYLNRLINTNFFHRYISGFANGTKIKHLDIKGLLNYKCEIPNEQVLKKFNDLMESCEKKKSKIVAENQELTDLRDFLLPLLMNGQVGFKG